MEEIVNRVAKSKLVTFNLEEYYPAEKRLLFDVKDWLYEGFVLREKEFRKAVKEHDWAQYKNQFVALTCSSDAIVPAWAYMLISVNLQPYAKKIVLGNLEDLEKSIYQNVLENLDVEAYKNLPVIIKGCANKPIPEDAYVQAVQKLQPVVKSLMFGEACSSVPLYKKKK
ncbi:DUF2480 family protein [Haloflavibacter putidus]|uniref:DUF2480 family protein n=1 Tax=Haloflavibacter putidus TaxID=2576776 RepID=A0A507ZVH4_9FLAO|nr:DUF2480 family protein [Haloflavibacter putidus]TQD40453.1 DUF2480 family protein [Haloflavibacter putidus]